jgi:tetratricopeptide (TPR) repeat protein
LNRAILDYNTAISLDPYYNPKVFWRRGLCYYGKGYYAQAISDYSTCLKLKPRYGRVHFYRGQAYGKLKMFEKAKKDLIFAAKLNKHFEDASRKVLLKMMSGEF